MRNKKAFTLFTNSMKFEEAKKYMERGVIRTAEGVRESMKVKRKYKLNVDKIEEKTNWQLSPDM